MDDVLILIVGCSVFSIVIGSAFVALLASDNPDNKP